MWWHCRLPPAHENPSAVTAPVRRTPIGLVPAAPEPEDSSLHFILSASERHKYANVKKQKLIAVSDFAQTSRDGSALASLWRDSGKGSDIL